MEAAGQKLKLARERLKLRYRDVEDASVKIANRHQNDEFIVALSRLSDIENKGTVPSIYRLYSLCVIYRLDPREVLAWYNVDLSSLPSDAAMIEIERTHMIGFTADFDGEVQLPLSLDPGIDLRRTTFLSRMIQRWGKLPLALLDGIDLRNHRYGYIGMEDWFMYPLLLPGALVVIDETKTKIAAAGWANEFDRPIYFIEHRQGYACGWVSLTEKRLVLQPHPASMCEVMVFDAGEVDVIGQVTGVAMRLDQTRKPRVRS